ncbi:MAG: hypothetical protein HY685_01045 [Chloroflexi bacterium]|nr:hypothetical protein [Chloroflexota bacterium]
MSDLEIRGAWNLLGPQQSGHISDEWFDLYTRLLAEAVEELRARRRAGPVGRRERQELLGLIPARPPVDLPLDAHIPEDYIGDVPTRLAVYQKMTRMARSEEVEEMRGELRDRFGPLPSSVEELLYGVSVRALATEAGVAGVGRLGGQVVVQLREGAALDRLALQKAVPGLEIGHAQLRLDATSPAAPWRESLLKMLGFLAAEAVARP